MKCFRYISVEIDNGLSITQPLDLNPQEVYNEIINKVKFVHGIVGLGSVKPGLKGNGKLFLIFI